MITIQLTLDQIDDIVVEELKCAYEMNMHGSKIDCSDDVIEPDYGLLEAIKKVLMYYMLPSEYDEWEANLQ